MVIKVEVFSSLGHIGLTQNEHCEKGMETFNSSHIKWLRLEKNNHALKLHLNHKYFRKNISEE